MKPFRISNRIGLSLVALLLISPLAFAQTIPADTAEDNGEALAGAAPEEVAEALTAEAPPDLRQAVRHAVAEVKPALVRIQVVSTRYYDGREYKYQSAGSGVIVRSNGYIVTNHHVAGHATRLLVTLANKEEVEAELVGKDPLTDIAVIKLEGDRNDYPTAGWGDSTAVNVGDYVLAMGSPMSLSQSVTLGIVSNTELVMPEWFGPYGRVEQDGEDVGSLVRWIAHDAQIYGGNSGGPLVNLEGRIVGINEISVGGLGGAIPGNLAQSVAEDLIERGNVRRAWLGIMVQPRLENDGREKGVLVSGALEDTPAEEAGFEPGDLLVRAAGETVDVQFPEQLPGFNQLMADLPIGEKVEFVVLRGGEEKTLKATPIEREKAAPEQHELKQWGITVRDISFMIAKQLKRDDQDGVLVTSVRPGGPAGAAKPSIESRDVIISVDGKEVKNLEDLAEITAELTEGAEDPVPTTVEYDRETQRYLTVVSVGIEELEDPGLEVKKAWLPVETQVLTRDISEQLPQPDLSGFRVTQVYEETTAQKAGLQVGDYILAVDGERLTADAPEDYDDLPQLIRQYPVGAEVELRILRDGAVMELPVELMLSPDLPREMKSYKDENFEFTVRNITFFDRAENKWPQEQHGVLVEEVESGGWADVALLMPGDLIIQVEGEKAVDVENFEKKMEAIEEEQAESVVFLVRRDIGTQFIEIEPEWQDLVAQEQEEE
jgi:serine protease Do